MQVAGAGSELHPTSVKLHFCKSWLATQARLTVELALLEDHGMTLPPETYPLRGFARDGQVNWRRTALSGTRRERKKAEFLNRVTFGRGWK